MKGITQMSKSCKRILVLLSAAITALTFCLSAAAAGIPSPDERFYVLDQASVLSDATKTHIVEKNDLLYYYSGAQIVVVTVPTTDSTPIREYASEIFTEWKIGSAEKNNGILVLLAIDDDDYWVVQGLGLESGLTSGDIKVLLDDCLEMSFREKEYDTGVLTLFDALADKLDSIYDIGLVSAVIPDDAEANLNAKADVNPASSVLSTLVIIAAIVIFIAIVISVASVRSVPRYIRRSARRRTPPPPRPMGFGGAPHHRSPPPPNRHGTSRPGAPRPSSSPRPSRPQSSRPSPRPSAGVGRSGGAPRSGGGGISRGGGAGRR